MMKRRLEHSSGVRAEYILRLLDGETVRDIAKTEGVTFQAVASMVEARKLRRKRGAIPDTARGNWMVRMREVRDRRRAEKRCTECGVSVGYVGRCTNCRKGITSFRVDDKESRP